MENITGAHLESKLLQKYDKKKTPEDGTGTYIERVTIPTLKMLKRFLDELVIDKKFNNAEELEAILKKWPEFAEINSLGLEKYWKQLSFDESSRSIFFPTEDGGKFIVALIKDFVEAEETPK
ncbi:MAG: hypothetical protein UT13_C0001G0262 [Candidatus Pacebacteria bacterium GW2011_GWF2_38_9]|nr:MAG: hypothetical protein US01_C0001G0266 [candidate division TM6 bacterium GW2011_GWF2_28_16]KKQ07401.1 MAG: hypothetical protein US20_C0039G0012 [Candidatus Pacebacteria bacterium GW2011_GWF1_36_5]KKQ88615.1 MAG: hypothetical protein UT13_C0001G0262 [Candidatus Pacebacteria bacterium GW2011_GWF2_38_9]HAZ73477.1 hypothetical protein [Candidatus Paceibacterota bacterium]